MFRSRLNIAGPPCPAAVAPEGTQPVIADLQLAPKDPLQPADARLAPAQALNPEDPQADGLRRSKG